LSQNNNVKTSQRLKPISFDQ